MRSKLFLAFFSVIIVALVSNLIYEHFIVADFEDYVSGTKEDKLYWVLAAVEGSYMDNKWDTKSLDDTLHWAMMLGFDVKIVDINGTEIADSRLAIFNLSPSMKKRMSGIIDINATEGDYESYPLYHEGKEIGEMSVRQLLRIGSIDEKDAIFKKRGREFLVISFVIAGGGAIFLSFIFSIFLSRPLNRMKKAVETMARGDFSVRLESTSRDEIGRLSASFNFMAEALEREEALRKHLTSNIAHELRTPLAVMKANVEGMMDGVIPDNREGLENMRIEVEKLIRLVEGIEDVTKAEASFFSKKSYTELNLSDFLSYAVSKISPLASAKKLVLHLDSDSPAVIETDSEKLDTIVQNILTNAIKYTKSGGIWVDYGIEDQLFFIRVRDSGAGIPETEKDLIFKRFYRGESSKGIGLGLAIVKELIDVMGGSIDVQSTEGKGSLFTIRLPRKRAS